jgi:ABC-type lipoprotein release transport system permease subunit
MERLRLLLRLALRNVRRQARRSLLTASAMVVGLALLILSRTLADGAHEQWIDSGVRLGSGHVTVQHPEFRARRSIERHVTAADREAAESALRDPHVAPLVRAVAPRIEAAALAVTPGSALPVAIIGIDPRAEPAFSEMEQRLTDGRFLEPGDRLHAFVGEALANRLQVELGHRVVLTAQTVDGAIGEQLVRLTGTFRTGIPEVDERLVFVPLATAQEWLGLGDAITSLGVLLDESWSVPNAARRLRTLMREREATAAVLTWREAMPELDAAVRMDDYGDYVFHIILFVIVALAIVNTVLMSVLYRTREFGVLQALGVRKRDGAALVVVESMILTGVSGVVGLVLGLGATWLFFRNGLDLSSLMGDQMTAAGTVIEAVFYPRFRLAQIGVSLAFVAAIGLLASLYPAYRATRIDIAEAMKFEA